MSKQHIVSWRNKKNISTLGLKKKKKKKKPFPVLCSIFNVKTVPLIDPILGSTKSGLNIRPSIKASADLSLKCHLFGE